MDTEEVICVQLQCYSFCQSDLTFCAFGFVRRGSRSAFEFDGV